MKVNEVLIKPILTEKATKLATEKVYTFEVNKRSSKNQIAKTIEDLYQVKVDKVRVVTRTGKIRRVGRKMKPKATGDRKIAYIYLKEGKIDLFPQP
jgi:large subunit ribosomal protein L23